MSRILDASRWPFTVWYVHACEDAMERLGIRPEKREEVMGQMTRAHGAPLQHLHALEEVVRRGGKRTEIP